MLIIIKSLIKMMETLDNREKLCYTGSNHRTIGKWEWLSFAKWEIFPKSGQKWPKSGKFAHFI